MTLLSCLFLKKFRFRRDHSSIATRCRPVLEALEDRIEPTSILQLASVDGYAIDSNVDGTFDAVNTTGASVQATAISSTGPTTDQSNTPTPAYVYNIGFYTPIGQEFRPTQSSLNYVDLMIEDAGSDIGPGSNFQVKIHAGTITGTVLGTSAVVYVPDNQNQGGASTYTRFAFSSSVGVTPNTTHVIEIVKLSSGTGTSNFGLVGDSPTTETYSAGRAILGGTPVTTAFDFNFRVGSTGQTGISERGVMEFNTADVTPGSVINSVTLTGTIGVLQSGAGSGISAGFYVYTGNGQIDSADATASATRSALLTSPALGQFSISLNAAHVQALIDSPSYNGYLGVMIRLESGQRFYLNSTESTASGMKPTLQIVYNATGPAPTASNDSYKLNPGQTQLTVAAPGVLANDNGGGAALTAQLIGAPSQGTVSLASDGSFVYTVNPGTTFTGPDSFTYVANNGDSDSNIATVTIRLNRPPVAFSRSLFATMNTTLNVAAPGILANNSDPDFDPLTAVLASNPSNGTLTLNSNGSLTYIPNPGFYGNDTFTFQVSDGSLLSNVATVTVRVNALPVAVNDSYSVNQDGVLTVLTSGVFANDTDLNGDRLTGTLLTTPTHGTISWNGSTGAFTYTPFPGYFGGDSFTYRATDGFGNSNPATVSITVNHVNHAPVAGNNSYTMAEDGALTIAAPGVLGNDSDSDGDSLTAVVEALPQNGTLALAATGSFVYTPAPNFFGTDTFRYKASDGSLLSNSATVTITINAVNDAPAANDDAYTTSEDAALTIAASGVLANDSDVEGNALTAILLSGPSHGSLTLNANGSFTYVPAANYNGSDSFTYRPNDGSANGYIATVSLSVTPVNDGPSAADDAYAIDEDGVLTIAAPGVLANDADSDGDALTAIIDVAPQHGTLSLAADGSFVYTPAANYVGGDTFRYKASDGSLLSNAATVAITINAVNDAPTASDDAFIASEDVALTIAVSGVLANDADVDGDALSAILVSAPSHGNVTLNPNGSFTYVPNTSYHGGDSFTYKANDGAANSNVANVVLTINPVNDAPSASDDDHSVNEDAVLTVSAAGVLGNDADLDGDALSAVLIAGPSHGVLSLSADGAFVYTPNANYHGGDSFTYQAIDGTATSATATVVVVVEPVNDAPTANAGANQNADEGAVASFDGTGSSDIDGDSLTYQWDFGDGGIASGATPSHSFADNGVYVVTLTVNDGQGGSDSDTMTVVVSNVAPTASVAGPGSGVRGQARTFTLNADDPSAVDQSEPFTFSIAWGDGATQTVSGLAGLAASHVYIATGTYTVTITATDKDEAVSLAAQRVIVIKAVDVQGTTLAVGGTTIVDTIVVKPASELGNLNVEINGANQGNFARPAQLVVYGQASNDTLQLATVKIRGTTYYVTSPAILFGDAGNDSIDARGSSANNVLVGGVGSDSLQGGSAADILLGGAGADTLRGNGGDDLVIGGAIDYDADVAALWTLLSEWGRSDANYQTRVGHLNGTLPGGNNGGLLLNALTVHDDAAIDQLYGQAGSDWFFAMLSGANKDKVNDDATGEIVTPM